MGLLLGYMDKFFASFHSTTELRPLPGVHLRVLPHSTPGQQNSQLSGPAAGQAGLHSTGETGVPSKGELGM